MAAARKITIEVRTKLERAAALRAYARLGELRGTVRFNKTVADLKADR